MTYLGYGDGVKVIAEEHEGLPWPPLASHVEAVRKWNTERDLLIWHWGKPREVGIHPQLYNVTEQI